MSEGNWLSICAMFRMNSAPTQVTTTNTDMTTPAPPDFRALCAELVDELNQYLVGYLEADLPDENTDETVLLLRRARAALNQPEPVGPTDEELEELAQPFTLIGDDGMTGSIYDEVGYARAVLSRWGRPAIEPIPVSERLPGPEDCGPGGICWLWDPVRRVWHLTHFTYLNPGDFWLPYCALLIPRSEENLNAT